MTCSREGQALVPGPATDIDNSQRRIPQVVAEMLVDHMRSDPPTQRRVVLVDEALCQRSPDVFARTVAHTLILPDRSEVQGRADGDPAAGGSSVTA